MNQKKGETVAQLGPRAEKQNSIAKEAALL
jgi:hypothetical protein